jgi:hypothetical protein
MLIEVLLVFYQRNDGRGVKMTFDFELMARGDFDFGDAFALRPFRKSSFSFPAAPHRALAGQQTRRCLFDQSERSVTIVRSETPRASQIT